MSSRFYSIKELYNEVDISASFIVAYESLTESARKRVLGKNIELAKYLNHKQKQADEKNSFEYRELLLKLLNILRSVNNNEGVRLLTNNQVINKNPAIANVNFEKACIISAIEDNHAESEAQKPLKLEPVGSEDDYKNISFIANKIMVKTVFLHFNSGNPEFCPIDGERLKKKTVGLLANGKSRSVYLMTCERCKKFFSSKVEVEISKLERFEIPYEIVGQGDDQSE